MFMFMFLIYLIFFLIIILGNEAPILQKLGIESLAEKYSAKIREQDKRLKRHHHRRRDDDRRGHKYRRHSHSKSRLLFAQFFFLSTKILLNPMINI